MISLVADGYKANFELGDLKVQLAQFSTIVDTDHVSDGWKKFGQKETLNSGGVMKYFLRNITARIWANHCIMVLVYCAKSNKPNMVEVAGDFKGSNQARLQVFERF